MNRSTKIRAIAALGTLSGAVWAGTYASFTDDAGSTATFTAGTLDLVVGGDSDDAHDFAALTVPNMRPGDVQYAALDVANAGSLGFSYGMTADTVDADGKPAGLGAALDLDVEALADGVACNADNWGASAPLVSGALDGATFSGRALGAGVSDNLCFRVTFPDGGAGADNDLQGAATTATFSFTAQS
jgi:predicted ribosomally synthesized peptide with SipW-like signal peptide